MRLRWRIAPLVAIVTTLVRCSAAASAPSPTAATPAASSAGFASALRNVSSLGLTFGGGCFYGHGVNVQGGRARFVLVSYQVQL